MIVQEVINWGCNELIDCFSLFGRADHDLINIRCIYATPATWRKQKSLENFKVITPIRMSLGPATPRRRLADILVDDLGDSMRF